MSCATDDYESISNAILLIKDTKQISEEAKKSLNSTRAIQLFSENAEMAFINKTLDSNFVIIIKSGRAQILRRLYLNSIVTIINYNKSLVILIHLICISNAFLNIMNSRIILRLLNPKLNHDGIILILNYTILAPET